ncbi:hypothetical protein BSL78_16899 [Apostichopus japonicus]|uniref:Transmembrane protein n=1 Tax=Stichopus japonicus TaxID=307972 RepID=A0A2G8KE44_STIJA|nr:hypothetical protein BSL78_16899 [Apostichopus japonicus]
MSECRRQCSPRSFLFGREDPQKFALPQARWPLLPGSFIAYRVIIGLYQVAVFITLLIKWGTPPLYSPIDVKAKWLIFISNWSFLVLTLYMIWAAFATCYWHMIGKKRSDDKHNNKEDIAMRNSTATETDLIDSESVILIPQNTWYFKINWLLQVIACSAEFAVTVLFWALEFNPMEGTVHFFNLSVHGLGAALVIIDFMLVANPFRLLHLYILFSMLRYTFCLLIYTSLPVD